MRLPVILSVLMMSLSPLAMADSHCNCDHKCMTECAKNGGSKKCKCKSCDCAKTGKCDHDQCKHEHTEEQPK